MKVAVIFNRAELKDTDVINVFGMQTKERYSPKIVEMVASGLEKGGHNVRIIEGNMHVIEELQHFMPRVVLGERPGMVFNMAYGIQGQYRYTHIPSMLEMLGIPYIGSGPAGHAIALDKVMSKIVFQRNNLPTPAFWVFSHSGEKVVDIRFPVIIKPRMEAVSFGLRVVDNQEDLLEAVDVITREFEQQALVEEFIPGREFGVALLGNGAVLETLPIVEIDLEGDVNAIQTVDQKLHKPRGKICPAGISSETADELSSLAQSAFHALDLFDFARVDFRMDPSGRPYLLEINSMASLNPSGSFVHAAQVAGMNFSALVNAILDVAAVRYFGASYAETFADQMAVKKTEPLHVKVRGYIRSNLTTMVDSIEQMVSLNSYVHNIEGVNRLGDWISDRFQQLGFNREVYSQAEVGNVIYFHNHDGDRNDILLLGHLDTVYDYQDHIPFKEERGLLFGSGVAESKGGIAVVLGALQALKFARVLKSIRCGVLLTPDDSLGGRFSKKIISEIARKSGHAIGMKYGDVHGGIVTSCAGTQLYQVEVTNVKSNKNSQAPDVLEFVSRKIIAWGKFSQKSEGVHVVINSMAAATHPGRTSDHANVSLLVRFEDEVRGNEIETKIRRIAERGLARGLQVRIRAGERRCPVRDSGKNRRFFEKVRQLADKLEIRVESLYRDSSSDICHVPDNIPVLGGFGPVGGDPQSANEYIIRDSLIDRAALLALIIRDCAKQN